MNSLIRVSKDKSHAMFCLRSRVSGVQVTCGGVARGCRCLWSDASRVDLMSGWSVSSFGGSDAFRYSDALRPPTIGSSRDLTMRVRAAGLNPLDVSMRGGYGSTLMKLRRDPLSLSPSRTEFPIILGRDVSGVVLECGSGVEHFKPGDEVWAAVPPWKQGSLAELVVLSESEVSLKPKRLSHEQAASIPFVASTVWSALVNAGGLNSSNCTGKRVLVIGGSGGVGTFSIQLLKAWGAHVTTTCSHDAERLVRSLGADDIIDYTAGDLDAQFKTRDKFDVILDNVGGDTEAWALGLMKPWVGAKFITLVTPVLINTDRLGLMDGLVRSGITIQKKAMTGLCNGVFYRWAFYSPDGVVLDQVRELVDSGKIQPVIEAHFTFSEVPLAFQKLEAGHARGKTVITVTDDNTSPSSSSSSSSHTDMNETLTT